MTSFWHFIIERIMRKLFVYSSYHVLHVNLFIKIGNNLIDMMVSELAEIIHKIVMYSISILRVKYCLINDDYYNYR